MINDEERPAVHRLLPSHSLIAAKAKRSQIQWRGGCRGVVRDMAPKARVSGADPGGALGRAPTPGTEGPAPKARVPSSQGQKEGTLVSLEWLFNTIQA